MRPRDGFLVLLASSLTVATASAQETRTERKERQSRQAELEKQFERDLTGAVLAGSFTTNDAKADQSLGQERYQISGVSKLAGKIWIFKARLTYGDRDITLPIPLKVEWAGDTPVITLTDQPIPGLQGTFSTRVLIYRDRYAGTWQHDEAGGHLFGTIQKSTNTSERERP